MSRSSKELMGTPNSLFNWIPGELVIIVRLHQRPADDTLEQLVEQVRSQLNAFLARYDLGLEPYGTYGRWLDEPTMPPVRRRAFVFALHRQQPLIAIFFHARHRDPAFLDPAPMILSYLQGQLERLAQEGLIIVSAMPNWLVKAAPTFYSDGGPAIPPRPAPALEFPTSENAPLGWRLSFVDQAVPLDPNGAQEVVVAVLDTAHHPDYIQAAASRPDLRRNWLLQRLASNLKNGNGSFEIEYNRYPVTTDVRTGQDFQNDPRYYSMPDHGLFVAGLIRDIAPRARIRLIRILNDFGGGDLYNLFAALTDLEQERAEGSLRHLVINLSLTIMPDIRRLPYVWFERRQWPSSQLVGAMRILAHIEDGLRLLFESLYEHGVLVVAAAGNDSFHAHQQGLPPRPPRSPARYETTLSVTSVNSRFIPSVFANAANIAPLDAGVATFGGDGFRSKDANALPDAVRGVFIAPTFPGGEQNTSGWADWCGSSFATPIISAYGAHLLAQDWRVADAITHIIAGSQPRSGKLFGSSPDAPNLLANIIRVHQRFKS